MNLYAATDIRATRAEYYRSLAACGIVAGCAIFNFALCFANTRLFTTTSAVAMASEGLLIGGALALILTGRNQKHAYDVIAIMTVIIAYFALLCIARGAFDPKPIRDLAIPVVFIILGRSFANWQACDMLIKGLVVFVLIVGLCEYFFVTDYVQYFNILNYYIAKGGADASALEYISDGLNINGQRPESQGRELLPWLLSGHRASSIFLEPVTSANFAAIAAAWFLQRAGSVAKASGWLAATAATIVLADGRFGLLLFLLAVVVFVFRRQIPLAALLPAPLVIVSLMILNYAFIRSQSFPNTFSGRLEYAAHLFFKFDAIDFFGLVTHRPYFDSGYAYAVTQFGLIGVLALWWLFSVVLLKYASKSYMVKYYVLYISLALMTSNSFYSIKASALMWFLIGMELIVRQVRFRAMPVRLQRPLAVSA